MAERFGEGRCDGGADGGHAVPLAIFLEVGAPDERARFVIPAKAGIQCPLRDDKMDPGFRRDDGL